MTGKVAGKIRKLRKAQAVERHVRLYRWLLESPAYRSLSLYARCLLVELKALYNGANNGELFLSVRDAAARVNTGTNQATAAFRQLEDRGFIKPRQRGSFQWKERHATCWLLTEYDDDMTGRRATMEFKEWQPDSTPKNKTRLPQRQQSVARAATDDRLVAQSVAGAATDLPDCHDRSVAGAATQIVYQGESPEEDHMQTTRDEIATAAQRAAPHVVETARRPSAKSFGAGVRDERAARSIDPQAPAGVKAEYASKTTLIAHVLALLESDSGSWRRAEIADKLNAHPGEVGRALSELCRRGYAARIGHGQYMATRECR